MSSVIVVGIAGPSGSGKSLLAERAQAALGDDQALILTEDAYYRDHPELDYAERCQLNYDHPNAFEHSLFAEHIRQLCAGQGIACPQYDYAEHRRQPQTRDLTPRRVLLIEGILIFHDPALRELMDLKVFVDAPADICLSRRIRRDTTERARTLESVLDQYDRTVRPMYLRYIRPTRQYADAIIPHGGASDTARDMIVGFLQQALRDHTS